MKSSVVRMALGGVIAGGQGAGGSAPDACRGRQYPAQGGTGRRHLGWYVAVAELLDAPLATLDGHLATSPGRCQFLLPPAET
jgi:hypothetical protein